METTNKNDSVTKEHNCFTLGELNIRVKIDSDTREREWDFLKGCWRDKRLKKGLWDLRFSR